MVEISPCIFKKGIFNLSDRVPILILGSVEWLGSFAEFALPLGSEIGPSVFGSEVDLVLNVEFLPSGNDFALLLFFPVYFSFEMNSPLSVAGDFVSNLSLKNGLVDIVFGHSCIHIFDFLMDSSLYF